MQKELNLNYDAKIEKCWQLSIHNGSLKLKIKSVRSHTLGAHVVHIS